VSREDLKSFHSIKTETGYEFIIGTSGISAEAVERIVSEINSSPYLKVV